MKRQYLLNKMPDGVELDIASGHIFPFDINLTMTIQDLKKLRPDLVIELCSGCLYGNSVHPNPIVSNKE